MRALIQELSTAHSPEALVEQMPALSGTVLLRTGLFDQPENRYSFVAARPFLMFRSFGSRCETWLRDKSGNRPTGCWKATFGNPWVCLERLMARYELLEQIDFPFPLGGCFGYWGYDLKNFVEPKLPRRATNDLELPDCQVGFYESVIVFDHRLGKQWVVATGLGENGDRSGEQAAREVEFWRSLALRLPALSMASLAGGQAGIPNPARSSLSRAEFLARVERALAYIRSGDVYQVNLAHRLEASLGMPAWQFFKRLCAISPAPFSAWQDWGDFQIVSSSPEQFLRLSGSHIQTRPIKGTRPRSADPTRDAQLTYELQTSAKEMAELVMITDLLRNDLGKVCEFGSVTVPELVRLERYPQVQHLVSTIEGRLRAGESHFSALAACFPGGSITGAPKFRAMEIIDELEPVARGAYTGALGYLGFNRESQLNIAIRTAICKEGRAYFHAGAGIVADSSPAAEYDETLAKARGFLTALECHPGVPEVKASRRAFRDVLR